MVRRGIPVEHLEMTVGHDLALHIPQTPETDTCIKKRPGFAPRKHIVPGSR